MFHCILPNNLPRFKTNSFSSRAAAKHFLSPPFSNVFSRCNLNRNSVRVRLKTCEGIVLSIVRAAQKEREKSALDVGETLVRSRTLQPVNIAYGINCHCTATNVCSAVFSPVKSNYCTHNRQVLIQWSVLQPVVIDTRGN